MSGRRLLVFMLLLLLSASCLIPTVIAELCVIDGQPTAYSWFCRYSQNGLLIPKESYKSTIDTRAVLDHIVEEIALKPRLSNTFDDECLQYHNYFRNILGLEPLILNQTLANEALEYADYLQSNDKFQHSNTKDQGENLYYSFNQGFDCKGPMLKFFGEYKDYYGKGSRGTGHFTQLIWPTTRMVGCAQKAKNSERTVVCKYYPQGNIDGVGLRVRVQNTSFYE